MNLLGKYIKQAEEKWFNDLYSYCHNLFSENIIPSHDHTHHLRVWNYSKEIIEALGHKADLNPELIEGSILASLFHDTGLTITLDENHGKESRKLCEQFFDKNNFQKPANFREILEAIELHDDKDYKKKNTDPGSLLSIICNADDLDAFGRIGVIRYTEIYLLRGISTHELPKKVIQNLDKRFFNFERTYKGFPELYGKHKERYIVTRKFFEELRKEAT